MIAATGVLVIFCMAWRSSGSNPGLCCPLTVSLLHGCRCRLTDVIAPAVMCMHRAGSRLNGEVPPWVSCPALAECHCWMPSLSLSSLSSLSSSQDA